MCESLLPASFLALRIDGPVRFRVSAERVCGLQEERIKVFVETLRIFNFGQESGVAVWSDHDETAALGVDTVLLIGFTVAAVPALTVRVNLRRHFSKEKSFSHHTQTHLIIIVLGVKSRGREIVHLDLLAAVGVDGDDINGEIALAAGRGIARYDRLR